MRAIRTILSGCVVAGLACGGGGGESSTGSGGSETSSGDPTTASATALETSNVTDEPGTSTPGTSTIEPPTTGTTDEPDTTATSAEPTTGDATTGGVDPAGPCPPLPAPAGEVVMVTPDQAGELANIVASAASGTTILLADGTYDVSGVLMHFTTPGLTLRSASGDRDAVVLEANYGTGETALIVASDTTIADLTLARAFYHPIHITGTATANTENVRIYNVKVIDPGQQAIKINPSPEGFYSDGGLIACSHLELTDAGRAQVKDNCYTGGVDGHSAQGWVIRDNYIEGFWCEQGLSEHGVHMWVTCRDTLVERNVIVDCARGIGFGLGENGNGKTREYGDDPCPGVAGYLGHIDGVIRNNTVLARRPELLASQAGFDSGIALEQACNPQVHHNTIASLMPPFAGMEYRWPNTSAILKNNLVSHSIKQRDGAMAVEANNIVDAPLTHFVDAPGGDLHLAADSPAIGAGEPGLVDVDFEGDPRDGAPDVGADERVP
jgi:hypothetical protein